MKYLVVLSCFLAVAYGISQEAVDDYKAKTMKIGEGCKSELGASDDDVAPMLKNEPPTSEKGKCVVACMHKKMGFQDASGKISKSGTEAALEKVKAIDDDLYGKLRKVADTCMAEVSDADNECETAHAMYVCVKREEKAVGVPQIDWTS